MESELIILISEIQSAPKFNKCVSNTHILTNALAQLRLCATTCLLFMGNIYVSDCVLLSSLLKTIKINGGVECNVCMNNSRFSTNIWSVTVECLRLLTIWTTLLAYRT